MRKSYTYTAFLFFTLLGIVSCQVERPKTILSDSKMEEVLYDYHIAKAIGEKIPQQEKYKRILYVEDIYKKHGITQADFDTSMVWFSRNPEIIHQIYERVKNRLKKHKEEIDELLAKQENKPSITPEGDSINIWYKQFTYQLTSMPLNNCLAFSIPYDPNFHHKDILKWHINFRFIKEKPDSTSAPIMAMQIIYANDSIKSLNRKIKENGSQLICLQNDTIGEFKEIQGFVYYPKQKSLSQTVLLSDISLMRYHSNDSLQYDSELSSEKTTKQKYETATNQKTEKKATNTSTRPNQRPIRRSTNTTSMEKIEGSHLQEALQPMEIER